MSARLRPRLSKLEARLLPKDDVNPSVVFGERDRTDDEIAGVRSNGQNIARQRDEAVEAMIIRAQRELRQKIVFLMYAKGRSGDTCIVFPREADGS